jgi:hypothetical protein
MDVPVARPLSSEAMARVFRDAAALIAEDHWFTTKCAAQDESGRPVSPREPRAVIFGPWGALGKALRDAKVPPRDGLSAYEALRRSVQWRYGDRRKTLTDVGVDHGPAGVRAAFQAAAEACAA